MGSSRSPIKVGDFVRAHEVSGKGWRKGVCVDLHATGHISVVGRGPKKSIPGKTYLCYGTDDTVVLDETYSSDDTRTFIAAVRQRLADLAKKHAAKLLSEQQHLEQAIQLLRTCNPADVNTPAVIAAAELVGLDRARMLIFGPARRQPPQCDAFHKTVPGCAFSRG